MLIHIADGLPAIPHLPKTVVEKGDVLRPVVCLEGPVYWTKVQ